MSIDRSRSIPIISEILGIDFNPKILLFNPSFTNPLDKYTSFGFDIYKPLGIKSFDSKSGAFYVMTDDVIAGIYSACLISLIILNIH